MIFSSAVFLFAFLPLVLSVYYAVPKRKWKNHVLLIASLMFYAWGEPVFVFVMIISILINYIAGIAVSKQYKNAYYLNKRILIAAIFFDLSILIIFKYLGFFVGNLNTIFRLNLFLPDISLPAGISFFTFQAISYVIDVYKKRIQPQKNLLKLALYLSLFPQLIAGPIVRYADIESSIDYRKENLDAFADGIIRFIIGLAKKVLLADSLALLADSIMKDANLYGGLFHNLTIVSAWLGAVAYAMQIYFDFSGYSDMAIGLGKMFGFEFQENFNYPYTACSIKDFWRRWHISLSSWFRDYVYIPLGGNRGRKLVVVRNLCIVWLLTGLWHGASWNFVLWGGVFLILLLVERYIFPIDKLMEKKINKVFYRIFTFICICCTWVIFRSTNIWNGIRYIGCMLGINAEGFYKQYDGFLFLNNWVLLFLSVICCLPWCRWLNKAAFNQTVWKGRFLNQTCTVIQMLILVILMFFSVAAIARGTYSPFIYYNF